MKAICLFLKAIFSGKILLLTVIAILTFGFSLYLAFIHRHETIEKILSDIGIAFLTTAIISAFDVIKGDEILSLIKLFSIDPVKKIAIVIAQFDKGYIVQDLTQIINPINLSEIPSMSKVDSFTVNHFVALFQSHDIDLEVITDSEAITIVNDENRLRKYSSFISVGLNSNKFSTEIAEKKLSSNVVKFNNPIVADQGNKIISLYENDNTFKDYALKELKCSDVVVFLKVMCTSQVSTDYSVIMCGGLNATGTNIIGPFVHDRWNDKIATQKFDNNEKIINAKNFILVYKANGLSNTRFDTDAIIDSHPIFVKKF